MTSCVGKVIHVELRSSRSEYKHKQIRSTETININKPPGHHERETRHTVS